MEIVLAPYQIMPAVLMSTVGHPCRVLVENRNAASQNLVKIENRVISLLVEVAAALILLVSLAKARVVAKNGELFHSSAINIIMN